MEVQLCHDCGLTDWDFGKNASKWSGVGYMRWRMGESCGAKGEIVKVAESERKSKHISPHLNIWDIDTWTINIIIANWRSRCDYRFAHDLSRHFCSAKRKINWYKGLTYNTTYTVSHMHIQWFFFERTTFLPVLDSKETTPHSGLWGSVRTTAPVEPWKQLRWIRSVRSHSIHVLTWHPRIWRTGKC